MECLNFATNVLVAIIGGAIVVLLGYNMWYSFNMNDIIKKQIDRALVEIGKENDRLRIDLISQIAASLCLTEAKDYTDKGWIDIAFLRYIKAIEHISKIRNENVTPEITDIHDQCLENSLLLIKKHYQEIVTSGTINNMSNVVEETLRNSNDKRSCELYSLLISLSEKSQER